MQPPAQAPVQPPAVRTQPGSRQTILIASYNVQVFGKSKEQKTPVMQTLAGVMRNFDLIAIQEIRIDDDDFLRRYLTYYLNPLSGRSYDFVLGPRLGRSPSKEQYAFIYDTARVEVNPNHIYTVRDPNDLLHREPLVAMFRARGPVPQEAFTFVLTNIHTDPDEVETEINDLAKAYHAVREAANGEDDIIVLGDLNADDRNLGELGRIPGIQPLVSGIYTNTRQTAQYDNILIHRPSTAEFVGRSGVFDTTRQFNLTHEQSLEVSDHFPVWAEFSVYESAAPGRVAQRPR
jgi:endonuclease/exonuclease/phosphatase family metal-dependent hydrolase